LGRYLGLKPCKQGEFGVYTQQLKRRVQRKASIELVLLYGSTSRNELTENSDLDVRIIRKRGLINGLSACWFALCERSWAFINMFPLDIYVLDDGDKLSQMRKDEIPIIIYNSNNILND
jgi:hypothetical protein